jgi:AAA+ superfamily predicted ATPase
MSDTGRRYELSQIELAQAKLDEYAYAMKTVDGDSLSEIEIREFFYGDTHSCIRCGVQSHYQHNKLQWVMQRFFEKFGYKQVRAVSYGYLDVMPPKMADIEKAPDDFFQGYEDATIYFEKDRKDGKEKDRIVVDVDEDTHSGGIRYTVYHNTDNEKLFTEWAKLADENNFYRGQKIDVSARFLKLNNVTWEDVILSDEKKNIVRGAVSELFEHAEEFRKFKINIQRGVILHGRPGTGKTQICRAVAREAGCSVLYALPTDFQKQGSGVRRVTEMAKDLAPCILIIEDMDWIAMDRDAGRAGFVMELMNQMDGIEAFGDIITLGTTNRKDELEDAVKNRPGRFDRLIEIDYPEKAERVKMIESFCKEWDIEGVNIEKIASRLDELSGAHIKEVCKTAAIYAVRRKSISEDGNTLLVRNEDFVSAWKEVKDKDMASYLEVQGKAAGNFGFRAGVPSDDFWDEL